MKITVMLTESCSHQDETRTLVGEAVAESGVDAQVEVVTVRTDEEARAAKVLGSPTIRVDGVDIEYGEREPEETQPGCRYYASPGGWKPVPDKGMIARAIERAQGAS